MAAEPAESKDLLAWYAGLRPLTVDIIGDFAGRELYVVHGESLIRHCLEQSRVDFNGGFQLLHAVYAVEKLLGDMQKRGCNFDIIFFRDAQRLCIAQGSLYSETKHKYLLARNIIIRHLSRSAPQLLDGARPQVLEFDSLDDDRLHVYLEKHAVHFFLCHEGDEDRGPDTVALRSIIHRVISKGINVAILNYVKFQSSKMFLPLVTKTYRDSAATVVTTGSDPCLPAPVESIFRLEDFDANNFTSALIPRVTSREIYAVVICRAIQESQQFQQSSFDEMTRAFLLHVSLLELCSLSQRRLPSVFHNLTHEVLKQAHTFIRHFSDAARLLLSTAMLEERAVSNVDTMAPAWDLYDLLDGRLFLHVLNGLKSGQAFPEEAIGRATELVGLVKCDVGGALTFKDTPHAASQTASTTLQVSAKKPSVLPFRHPVLDKYIYGMTLEEAEEQSSSATDIIFNDLTHWHNSKNSIDPKTLPRRKGFFARKRQQKLMAGIEAYSRSLTNVGGGNLVRETIIVDTASRKDKEKSKGPPSSRRAAGVGNGEEAQAVRPDKSGPKRDDKKKQPGGKEAAYLAAKQLQDAKEYKARDIAAHHWASKVAAWETNMALSALDRYVLAEAFFLSRYSKKDMLSLRGEVELYLCHVLGIIWRQTRTDPARRKQKAMYLLSCTWKWLLSSSSRPVSLAVQQTIRGLTSILGAPSIPLTVSPHDRRQALSFRFSHESFNGAKELVTDHKALQLEHGGPYMDRRFDSKPDGRVPFEPDAWQRDVLNSIDSQDTSLLVIAPTSAGKTFISFYAMKRVLQESDDAVLVYVAPTKALVNQIAAEINAHYSKSYPGKAGKSVYGIHTRDYRVNNPTGCQILVTVPHVLQILLLSPANAMGPNAWSRRVKRIIFDEVHCIGQSEDGVIWEQLLLLAPCPVIALSATVGNPAEFRDWLAASQARKGFRLDMVVHDVRYSELRKFIYTGSTDKQIRDAMARQKTVSAPGLDEGEHGESGDDAGSIQFLHPVVALGDRNKDALADMSFEARDLFTLWKAMKDLLPKDEIKALDVPDPFSGLLPPIIAKSDVIAWERKMKKALRELMDARPSVFIQLRSRFKPPPAEKEKKRKPPAGRKREPKSHIHALPSLAHALNARNALPALVFNYDRRECEECAQETLRQLIQAEGKWKDSSPEWARRLQDYNDWLKAQAKKTTAVLKKELPSRDKASGSKERVTELDVLQDSNADHSRWERFDPNAPLEGYSFADHTKLQGSEFEDIVQKMLHEEGVELKPWMGPCLRRGIGVHHSGLNRRYRQTVEMLFRRGFLRLVIATGTLAMGINMPCKTVIFSGDSVFLTAQNYRQSSGRAGRRGFDLLGNVVFSGIGRQRVYEIMASRLPALRGQFPISTTLILRLLALLHGTNNSDFAVQAVDALLSQTRLYLGGPEAEDSVRHHLRFSIEYMRRQNLVSASGEPLNFAGVVSHLYFTENAVFAFHSLLKGGYFHRLCAGIRRDPDGTRLEMILVLSHLFSRIPVKRTYDFEQAIHRSASVVFLPRLPSEAEALLAAHNRETLSIFKDYVHSYISHSLRDKPDRTLPFTQTDVGGSTLVWRPGGQGPPLSNEQTIVRSPFVSLSGFDDNFTSIHDLCSTVRGGVFLEESAIPYIPVWGIDPAASELNAYIYDFYKHGSLEVLTRDNRIRGGDVWFLLKDFSLTLSTIVAGLEGIIVGGGGGDGDEGDQQPGDEDLMEDVPEDPTEARSLAAAVHQETNEAKSSLRQGTPDAHDKSRKKAKETGLVVRDSWNDDDDDDDDESEQTTSGDESRRSPTTKADDSLDENSKDGAWTPYQGQQDSNLMTVLEAMVSLRDDFSEKFRRVWA